MSELSSPRGWVVLTTKRAGPADKAAPFAIRAADVSAVAPYPEGAGTEVYVGGICVAVVTEDAADVLKKVANA